MLTIKKVVRKNIVTGETKELKGEELTKWLISHGYTDGLKERKNDDNTKL